ncbi:MAG: hypothetical protein JNK30_16950 [Phenylobacterium sp.]|uniref:hypothetical protein n=1 Tax=Phenylobacterium sp. TaxID=1871053 RepID=UPI001A3E3D9D|nr:hypothetical protein [Phenylobacterium sp.]MBL8773073.1 hypothetical protein [Phenylobacterium sp.]
MSRIDRVRRAVQAHSASRTSPGRAQTPGGPATTGLPVPVAPIAAHRTFREETRPGHSELAAHLMGQDGQRRGLRAGPALVNVAQAAYNRVEWSGSFDRRARKGTLGRTEV